MREITFILKKEKHSWNIQDQPAKNSVIKGRTKKEAVAKLFSFDSSTSSGIFCLLDEKGILVKKRIFRNKLDSMRPKHNNPEKNSLNSQKVSIESFLKSVAA